MRSVFADGRRSGYRTRQHLYLETCLHRSHDIASTQRRHALMTPKYNRNAEKADAASGPGP